jgi:hypothetical protein
MPINLLKKYNDLLELLHLSYDGKISSLKRIFSRDFENNSMLRFLDKKVNPTPGEEPAMSILFRHLTTVVTDKETKKREFENDRSERLHWVKFHLDRRKESGIWIFSVRDAQAIRTYIYDVEERYVIILEPYRNGEEYYLLTAYLVTGGNRKKIVNKYKRRLPEVY